MPIRPDNMGLYPGGSIHSPEWKAIRQEILQRALNQCEKCRAPNNRLIARGQGQHANTYMLERGETFDADTGEYLGMSRSSEYCFGRMVQVVLTIAHLDHDPTNNAPSNLKALCQLHHNRLDAKHRASSRRRNDNMDLFLDAVTA